MCLLLLAVGVDANMPLVVAANRDEFRDRPSAPAAFWEDAPGILAGRDLEAGGTWLGVSRSGRFAAVTNVRDGRAARSAARSRGRLVSGFLSSRDDAETYLRLAADEARLYGGFNLVAGGVDGLFWLSNRAPSAVAVRVSRGVHGISNALLDTPWPKLTAARESLASLLGSARATAEPRALPASLFGLLSDTSRADDAQLPDTGIGLERERILAPAFIDTPEYGTRTSTVVFFRADGSVELEERTHESGRPNVEERRFSFTI
ncbi:MAG TPA: NRDE family protein [Thermoanaerobaculia bacterium]|nr:NRDE family protein [Thermoanaerobaculia bacterium]